MLQVFGYKGVFWTRIIKSCQSVTLNKGIVICNFFIYFLSEINEFPDLPVLVCCSAIVCGGAIPFGKNTAGLFSCPPLVLWHPIKNKWATLMQHTKADTCEFDFSSAEKLLTFV